MWDNLSKSVAPVCELGGLAGWEPLPNQPRFGGGDCAAAASAFFSAATREIIALLSTITSPSSMTTGTCVP